jgi:pentatricopeptide repeat protein
MLSFSTLIRYVAASLHFQNLQNPKFIRFISSSTTTLYSQFHHQDKDEQNLVCLFNQLLHHNNPTPSIIQFGKILGSLVKLNHYSTVISLHPQMELHGIASDLVTSNILINCFSQLGQPSLSFSVFANILKKGYHPDATTFNTLIKALCLNGQVNEALHFHDKVVAQGFQLDSVSYGTLINGLCKVGQTRPALQLLRQIDGKLVRPNVIMYNTVIDGMCKDKH